MSLNVKYTYTNGSIDRKVFYFVVQDSAYTKPEYETQVNFPAIEQKSPATIPEDKKETLYKQMKMVKKSSRIIREMNGLYLSMKLVGKLLPNQ